MQPDKYIFVIQLSVYERVFNMRWKTLALFVESLWENGIKKRLIHIFHRVFNRWERKMRFYEGYNELYKKRKKQVCKYRTII